LKSQLYRSVELNHLHGGDLERFAELRIRTVFFDDGLGIDSDGQRQLRDSLTEG
jgi:hypothetical protein